MSIKASTRALIRAGLVVIAYLGLCFWATYDVSYSDVLPVRTRPITFYMKGAPMVLLLWFGLSWAIWPLLKRK